MAKNKNTTQDFLDSSQYQEDSILGYERIYGEDFVSPGGQELAREFIAGLKLDPGSKVLDVGCGLGGSAFLMAREFGLRVDGIDLSKNMLALANQKLARNGFADSVNLYWGDCLELDGEKSYDAIDSRDVFLHIDDKPRLFSVLKASLRAGGKLLITDYCCGPKPWSSDFEAYVEDRSYSLYNVDDYADFISSAGFEQVVGKDISTRFIEILELEMARIAQSGFDADEAKKLERSWQQKLLRARAGDHRWGLFNAIKAKI